MLTGLLLGSTPDADFVAPDTGSRRTPYACTFHWFRTADGRVVGLDVIRSDDTGRRGLRVFVFDTDGSIRALVHEAPADQWAPFVTDGKPGLDGGTNQIARGPGWVVGSVRAPGQTLSRARFTLDVRPEGPGQRLRPPLGGALRLRATDYLEAHTRGFIELDGERVAIDARGPLSVHHGLRLTRYAYVAAIPAGPAGARLVSATVGGDSLRIGGGLLGERAVTYALGSQGLPARSLHLGRPVRDLVLDDGRRLVLDEVRTFPHMLLGEPTVTALARGRLTGNGTDAGDAVEVTVVIDNRGEPFASLLAPEPAVAAGAPARAS